MGISDLLIAALALWRASSLATRERGPLDVFLRLRAAAGIAHDEDGEPSAWDEARYSHALLTCVWCLSVNLGALLALAWWYAPDVARWLCTPLALSACAIALDRVIHG